MTRNDLQTNAQAKLDDAVVLLISLKASVAAQITAETDKAFIKNILNHQFRVLVGLTGLSGALKDEVEGMYRGPSKDRGCFTNAYPTVQIIKVRKKNAGS